MKLADKSKLLKRIERDIAVFKESPLYPERIKNGSMPVPGEGNPNANVMLIGEAPGKNEAKTGRPFVGAAGKILDELLASANLNRENVFITSILKDRPPNNRDPRPVEIDLYAPFLDRQINIIQPSILVAMGRFSAQYVMEKFGLKEYIKPIGEMHGIKFKAKAEYGEILIVPVYHPAAGLYNPSIKGSMKDDFKKIKKIM